MTIDKLISEGAEAIFNYFEGFNRTEEYKKDTNAFNLGLPSEPYYKPVYNGYELVHGRIIKKVRPRIYFDNTIEYGKKVIIIPNMEKRVIVGYRSEDFVCEITVIDLITNTCEYYTDLPF